MAPPRGRRVGHGRPVGSVTAAYRFSWHRELGEPQLGDVTFETPGEGGDPFEIKRAFLLVGIEETASRARPYRLIFERLDWADALARVDAGDRFWYWHSAP